MSLGSWLKKKAKQLKDFVEDLLGDGEEEVSDAIESGGNAAKDKADQIADAVKDVPIIGGAVASVVRWTGRVTAGICELAANIVKGIGAFVKASAGLVLGIIEGIVTGSLGTILDAFVDYAANIFGGILIIAGGFISLVQIIFGTQKEKRKLTEDERELLELIYQKTLKLNNIRIVEGRSGIYSFNDRPFVKGNLIYMKNISPADWNWNLVHESVHVWQYQHYGARYAADALGASIFLGKDRAYNWLKEIRPWTNFNAEAQAEFFEDLYKCGEIQNPAGWIQWIQGDGGFFMGDAITSNRFRFSDLDGGSCWGDAKHPLMDLTDFGNETVDHVRSQAFD